jgi:hypothetical protein
MRVTTERIPNTNTLQKEIAIPLGVIVKPYGDLSTVSDFGFNSYLLGRGDPIGILWIKTNCQM